MDIGRCCGSCPVWPATKAQKCPECPKSLLDGDEEPRPRASLSSGGVQQTQPGRQPLWGSGTYRFPGSRKDPPPGKHTSGTRAPCQGPHKLTKLMMAMVSRLPMVSTARDSLSRGCVSTLAEMAWSVPHAGQHLCGHKGSSHPEPAAGTGGTGHLRGAMDSH